MVGFRFQSLWIELVELNRIRFRVRLWLDLQAPPITYNEAELDVKLHPLQPLEL